MSSAIKSFSIRFNKEAAPFQHIRVEVNATITKDDDKDEIRNEAVHFAFVTFGELKKKIFTPKPITPIEVQPTTTVEEPKEEDNVPY